MKRILVIRGGAIGDFVLTLPAIKLLRDRFPEALLEILGYKHIGALAEKRVYADATRSIEYSGLSGFFARGGDLRSELADYFHSFDLAVSYLFDPDRIFETNLARCGVDLFVPCSPKITSTEHAAVQLARPLEQLDLKLRDRTAKLFPNEIDRRDARAFVKARGETLVALHPGSGSRTKNWPIARWCDLARHLLDSRMFDVLLIVGGEADAEVIATMKQFLADKRVAFAESLPLPQLAAVLEQCALFVGHDSGISHVAAAVGTPCVLLFGVTDPAVWAPANANVRVLRAPNADLTELTLASVVDAIAPTMN